MPKQAKKPKREPIKKRNKSNFNRLVNQGDREEALLEIGRLLREGYSQNAVATMMGVTPGQIVYDVKILKQRYLDIYMEAKAGDIAVLIAEKLEQLKDVRREAWAAWHRSKEDATKQVEESGVPRGDKDDDDGATMTGALEKLKVIVTREGRLPENVYLVTILKTIEAERQLLGLDEPTKIEGKVAVFDWSPLLRPKAQVPALTAPDDPVEAKLRGLDECQQKTESEPTDSGSGSEPSN